MSESTLPLEDLSYGFDLSGTDPASLNDALRAVAADAMMDPMRLATWMSGLAIAQQQVGLNTLRRMSGENPQPVVAPAAGDRRFANIAWKENPFLMGAIEEYLVRSKAAQDLVESSRLPDATRRKAKFAVTMMMDALAPSNVPWLNPAVIKEATESGGSSLVQGLQNFIDDVKNNGGMPRQVDTSKFTIGGNLAITPGRVVFRNELIELIAYDPQTEQVHERPLLCCPPWINKYYIMDLAPGRSFVQWAVRHGHQAFMISYRNPDTSMANFTMDDYLRLGPLAAIDAIERITGAQKINIAALCLGGTLALIMLAHLAELGGEGIIGSAALTNTLIDFSEPGDLGVFTDESSITRLEKKMSERGFLDSSEMAGTFNWMRANDLIWSYVVNNWFMGKQPPAFDILAWNGDSTRMPAAMHSQYLRTCYLHNAIVKPNATTFGGTPIDLGKIRTPLYVLGAETDHIAPWRSTYMNTQHTGGENRFTLTNSGHIAGIVNPPGSAKSCHWTQERATHGQTADQWRAGSQRHEGSWWEDWAIWAQAHGGPMVVPYQVPNGEPAPGHYVINETAPQLEVPE